MITVYANYGVLTVKTAQQINSGSQNYFKIKLEKGVEWNSVDYTDIYAVFYRDNDIQFRTVFDNEGYVTIPNEILDCKLPFYFGIYTETTTEESSIIQNTNFVQIKLSYGAFSDSEHIIDINPDEQTATYIKSVATKIKYFRINEDNQLEYQLFDSDEWYVIQGGGGGGITTIIVNGEIVPVVDETATLPDYPTKESLDIDDLENAVDTLNETVESLGTTVSGLTAEVESLQTEVSGVENSVSTLQTTVSGIQSDITTIYGEIDDIQGDITSIEEDITTIENNIETLSNGLQEAEQDIQELTNDVDSLEQGLQAEIDRATGAEDDISDEIDTINSKIPAQASSSNQLADKNFVNSTVQTTTANFRGNWTNWASVPINAEEYPADYAGVTTPSTNDYMVVQDASGYGDHLKVGTWRFKYTGVWQTDGRNGWQPEYQVNETPMTSAQLASLNSGITAESVAQISTNAQNIADLQTNKLSASDLKTIDGQSIVGSGDISIPVKGALLGGTQATIDANGNIVIPIADNSNIGLFKIGAGLYYNSSNNTTNVAFADILAIANRTASYAIPANLINDILIAGLTDANHITFNATQQATARAVIGAGTPAQTVIME